MDWTSNDKTVTLLHGDCLERLRDIPTGSVHCCLSSPPYFALRQYLPKDHPDKAKEIGSEPTPEAFIASLVQVFREVRRTLRDDGTVFLNLADSYNAAGRVGHGTRQGPKQQTNSGTIEATDADRPCSEQLGDGNQLLIPHRVALALQADGWILRDTIIWAKVSAMPQSVNGVRYQRCRVKVSGHQRDTGWSNSTKDRPQSDSRHTGPYDAAEWAPCPGCKKCEKTGGYVLRRGQARTCTSHEYVFMLTKTNRYFADMENWRESAVGGAPGNKTHKGASAYLAGDEHMRTKLNLGTMGAKSLRVRRNVWKLPSEPTRFHHFATMPSELVRRCLLALSKAGCCPHCGAQWAPVIEMPDTPARQDYEGKNLAADPQHSSRRMLSAVRAARNNGQPHDNPFQAPRVIGYRPTCDCEPHEPAGCLVLDPFSGTGTTGQTARFLGHRYIGIELNEKYLEHAKAWIFQAPRWHIREQAKATKKPKPLTNQRPLAFMDQS